MAIVRDAAEGCDDDKATRDGFCFPSDARRSRHCLALEEVDDDEATVMTGHGNKGGRIWPVIMDVDVDVVVVGIAVAVLFCGFDMVGYTQN